jgi:hypothetical protein
MKIITELGPIRETPNTVIYGDASIGGAYKIYIPKADLPRPFPTRITMTLESKT